MRLVVGRCRDLQHFALLSIRSIGKCGSVILRDCSHKLMALVVEGHKFGPCRWRGHKLWSLPKTRTKAGEPLSKRRCLKLKVAKTADSLSNGVVVELKIAKTADSLPKRLVLERKVPEAAEPIGKAF
jgi:hypothetical protein